VFVVVGMGLLQMQWLLFDVIVRWSLFRALFREG